MSQGGGRDAGTRLRTPSPSRSPDIARHCSLEGPVVQAQRGVELVAPAVSLAKSLWEKLWGSTPKLFKFISLPILRAWLECSGMQKAERSLGKIPSQATRSSALRLGSFA